MRRWLWILLLVPWPALAQQICTPERTWTFDPAEKDNVGFQFVGRTLASVTSATAALIKRTAADANPTGLITASSVSGDTLSPTLAPNTGCGAAGCRAGNVYQISVQATDSATMTPMGHACLVVRKTALRQP